MFDSKSVLQRNNMTQKCDWMGWEINTNVHMAYNTKYGLAKMSHREDRNK